MIKTHQLNCLNEYQDLFCAREIGNVTISYKIEGEPCPYQGSCKLMDKCSLNKYNQCSKITDGLTNGGINK